MEEREGDLYLEEEEENKEQKVYGVRWLHLIYKIGMPVRAIFGLVLVGIGVEMGDLGGVLAACGAIYALAAVYVFLSYWKNRWIGVYSKAMYYVTFAVIWLEFGASLFAFLFNPLLPIGAVIFAVCNTVYFYHRKYLFVK